jgi:hypothetical protein
VAEDEMQEFGVFAWQAENQYRRAQAVAIRKSWKAADRLADKMNEEPDRPSRGYVVRTLAAEFQYSRWRHGGWYVDNVRYPSGAVGCVSCNYPDRKWRIVCAGQDDVTYPDRDAAARAELALTQRLCAELKASSQDSSERLS